MQGRVSPLLGISFGLGPEELELRYPDGRRVASYEEVFAERERAERLAARLRALGVDPDVE